MRDSVLALLKDWKKTLAAQDADPSLLSDDAFPSGDHYLDRHLHGVALFLKTVAHRADDMELLGLCSKIEMDLKERFAAEDRAFDEQQRAGEREAAAMDAVKEVCIRYFYKEQAFSLDLSKYRQMIDEAVPRVTDSAELKKLRRYIDEKRWLDRLYATTKNSLMPYGNLDAPLPTFDDVKTVFEDALADLLRRADKYVPAQLERLVNSGAS
jgi:hypothetical protein